jgi:hypothetical protein
MRTLSRSAPLLRAHGVGQALQFDGRAASAPHRAECCRSDDRWRHPSATRFTTDLWRETVLRALTLFWLITHNRP